MFKYRIHVYVAVVGVGTDEHDIIMICVRAEYIRLLTRYHTYIQCLRVLQYRLIVAIIMTAVHRIFYDDGCTENIIKQQIHERKRKFFFCFK